MTRHWIEINPIGSLCEPSSPLCLDVEDSRSFSPPSCAPVHGARDFSFDTHPNEAAGARPFPIADGEAIGGACVERRAHDDENRVFAGHALIERGASPPPLSKSGDVTSGGGENRLPLRGGAAAARRSHTPEVGGASPPPAILDPTTETQRTQRAHESWGSGSNPVHPLRGPRIGLSASVVNESRSHEAAITPGAVAHARRRVLPDAVAVLIRIGWMVVGAAAWAAMGIHITPGQ